MSTCRSLATASVSSPNDDPLDDIDPADLDRFVRHLAEAAASWHRGRQSALVPFPSADRAALSKVA